MTVLQQFREKYAALGPLLNERQCRLWAATEARALGRGGVTLVARATGISRKRIQAGVRELEERADTTPATAKPQPERVRRAGGGRHSLARVKSEVQCGVHAGKHPGAGANSRRIAKRCIRVCDLTYLTPSALARNWPGVSPAVPEHSAIPFAPNAGRLAS